ncbi:MAG: hypothetical protein Q7U76_13065 [Nitrospirota bacterium]|nr:hypothetical protein [Nitrospirota bacterium]
MNIPVTIQLVTTMPAGLERLLTEGLRPEDAARLFPNTIRRLSQLAQVGVDLWKEKARSIAGTEGRPLTAGSAGSPMVRLDRKGYEDSIVLGSSVAQSNGLSIEIYSDSPQAMPIEEGSTIIDLHAVLPYARKVKMSKSGKRYLSIPFRHATTEPGGRGGSRFQSVSNRWGSNVLPPQVVAAMRKKTPSTIIGTTTRPSVNYPGQHVKQNLYSPHPGRLTPNELRRLGLSPLFPAGRKLVGLMRTGAQGHSSYITIRTLSEANPEGWRIPAYQAQHVASATARGLQALSSDWFDQAIRADLDAVLHTIDGGA